MSNGKRAFLGLRNMPDWHLMFALPNMQVHSSVEVDGVALVSAHDDRIKQLMAQYPNYATYLASFRNEFGAAVSPSSILVRDDAPVSYHRVDALASFRDVVAFSSIPYTWMREFEFGGGQDGPKYANTFVFYSLEEMKAAVDVAKSYNSYVAAHVFTDEAVQLAVKAGIKTIEHGMLIGRETLEMMKENGVWLSIQPILDDEDRMVFPSADSNKKFRLATAGTEKVYALAKEIGVKIAFGTDALMDPAMAAKQGKLLSKLKRWFTPYEALKMATSDNAKLMEMAGPRHPYQEGPLGVIKEGAYDYAKPNPEADAHYSLTGAWWLAEFLLKRHYNWKTKQWERRANLGRRRTIPPKSLVHESAYKRGSEYQKRLPADAIRTT